MSDRDRRRMPRWSVVFVAGLLLIGAEVLLDQVYGRTGPSNVWLVWTMILAPILGCGLAMGALVWMVIGSLASHWKMRRLWVVCVSLVIASILYIGGPWLQSLYGLDPPYILFNLGFAMEIIALMIPIGVVGWLGVAAVKHRRQDLVARP